MIEEPTGSFSKFNKKIAFHLFSIYASILILFTRRPDAFQNPQFWAEDGRVWYEDAYNQGIIYSLTTPEVGYLQTISRLTAIFSQIFPLAYAPLIFNIVAITTKVLIVQFILSKRMVNSLPTLWMRIVIAFLYLGIPHSYEVHANVTNMQWHLALLSCLIIIAVPATTKIWKVFDFTVIAISALSGPFCLFLLPIAFTKYYYRKNRWFLTLIVILAVGCLLQGGMLLSVERPIRAPLGANINLLLRILGGQIFVGAIFGEVGFAWTVSRPFWKDGITIIVNLLGLGLLLYGFVKSNLELRLLMLFAIMIMIGALVSPMATDSGSQWQALFNPITGTRYWFIPIFCFLATICWIAQNAPDKVVRGVGIVLLLASAIGIALDWRYPPYQDYSFQKYAFEFEGAASGTEVKIPINPPGWEVRLKKR